MLSTRPRVSRSQALLRFNQRLVLNQWLLSLFEVVSLEKLITPDMKKPECEGYDENNVSLFYHELTRPLFNHPLLTNDDLLRYDENILRHTKTINEHRGGEPIRWKYFQYLALLFTEIYLDRYFSDPEALLQALNAQVESFNLGEWPPHDGGGIPAPLAGRDQVDEFEPQDLRKLAFWMATGSGKTLLMHVNILQYRDYLQHHGREKELNRTILLTPNEGLSRQHLEEFEKSGMAAELFSKDAGSLFRGHAIEIIDIHKLREDMGDKTVAVDAFEGNNLVLVDEGHRGASGFEWKDKRDRLCEKGFSFEYSATFGQALKAANKPELTQEYCKSILFDYSYRYFYKDGYGKEYRILNLAEDNDEEVRKLYLTACLLAFYQQQRLYQDKEREFRPFLLEKPLWVFVGRSVTAGTSQTDKQTMSDVILALKFLADFVSLENRSQSVRDLDQLLSGSTGLVDERSRDIFANAFTYLVKQQMTGEEVFDDIIRTLFNAPAPGLLHVQNLKGVDGEIVLRVGDNEPFGLINVGEDTKLCNLCEQHGLDTDEWEFSQSLFGQINQDDSTINMLIGAKKFTEGWNSWRVSTMGLLNIGRKEGSEIIQLFGRGVRLKGYEHCLKRSTRLDGITIPEHVKLLETLNVFGIRASYMQQFKEYLEEEGLPTDDDRKEIVLPVIKNLGRQKLKIIDVKKGMDFKKCGPKPHLQPPDARSYKHPVVVNWYPKVQAKESAGAVTTTEVAQLQEGKLTWQHIAFLDIDELYFDLQQLKNERGWYNLNLSREAIAELLGKENWYSLFIPEQELQFDSFRKVRRWQEIAGTLLRKYCDRYYKHEKAAWEAEHLEVRELTPEDPNFIDEYRILIEKSMEEVVDKLKQLKTSIEENSLQELSWGNLHAIVFDQHLYSPLLYIKYDGVEVSPVALNDGERGFVQSLRVHYQAEPGFFADKELYLLRNQSRGKGIGFFEAGNFHPDFILWLVEDNKQFITFVDPKGIRNLDGIKDQKILFHKTIKEIETRINDPSIILNSCIISVTSPEQLPLWAKSQEDMAQMHVFFQDDPCYISKVLAAAQSP